MNLITVDTAQLAPFMQLGKMILGVAFALWLFKETLELATKGQCDYARPVIRVGFAYALLLALPSLGAWVKQPSLPLRLASRPLLEQIRARGERAVVYDHAGTLTKQFFRPERDRLLSPRDPRCQRWSPWAEGAEPARYELMGRALFAGGAGEAAPEGAQAVFAELLRRLDLGWGPTPASTCSSRGRSGSRVRWRFEGHRRPARWRRGS